MCSNLFLFREKVRSGVSSLLRITRRIRGLFRAFYCPTEAIGNLVKKRKIKTLDLFVTNLIQADAMTRSNDNIAVVGESIANDTVLILRRRRS